jgi:hypothetical protein
MKMNTTASSFRESRSMCNEVWLAIVSSMNINQYTLSTTTEVYWVD